jgi:hypothetical protein
LVSDTSGSLRISTDLHNTLRNHSFIDTSPVCHSGVILPAYDRSIIILGGAYGNSFAQVLIRWGDPVFRDSPSFNPLNQSKLTQEHQFGYNCDYVAYLPLPHHRANNPNRALLWVNHEYTKTNRLCFRAERASMMHAPVKQKNKRRRNPTKGGLMEPIDLTKTIREATATFCQTAYRSPERKGNGKESSQILDEAADSISADGNDRLVVKAAAFEHGGVKLWNILVPTVPRRMGRNRRVRCDLHQGLTTGVSSLAM